MPSEAKEINSAGDLSDRVSKVSAGTPVRILALLVVLFASPAYEAYRITAFSNGDIWWHLRTGLWILQNHAVPRSGLFSQLSNAVWVDPSWGFQALTAAGYRLLGLRAIPALLIALRLGLAAVSFVVAYARQRNFWQAALLSAAAQCVIVDLQPLPRVVSILFFGIEAAILLQARSCGSVRPLYWLPPLFFVWANLDAQFLNGLLLLGAYLLAELAERILSSSGVESFSAQRYSLAKAAVLVGVSIATTLLNPYLFHLYASAWQTSYGKALLDHFAEMEAMAFRRPRDFALLTLVMAAFFALGRQRSRDLFKIGTLVGFAILAFRFQRDAWCVVFPAVAIISDYSGGRWRHPAARTSSKVWRWERATAALLVATALIVATALLPGGDLLIGKATRFFPQKACDFIRANHLPQSLFNTYSWGGFVIWYLPQYPVSIDGRMDLYGEEAMERYFKVVDGKARLETDPSFARAQTFLLEKDSGMSKALTTLPALRSQFRVVYEDELATVLVRQ